MFQKVTCLLIATLSPLINSQNPDKCLGEFEYCADPGVCAMDCADASKCESGEYVCPISKQCFSSALDYVYCPGLKGTHLDWNLTLSERVNYLINNLSLDEKYGQLTNQAPAINRAGIPFYNYRSNDVHSIAGVKHSTVFPNGCGLGATFSKHDLAKTGYIIGYEQRALHNSFVHQGNRNPNDGGAITNNGPNINLVRDPRWGRSQEVYSEDPRLSSHLAYEFVSGMQYGGLQNDKYLMIGVQCKHYAVYNVETSRFQFNAIVDAVNWAETYSPVFRECVVRANAAQVMCSYNSINGIPACGNYDVLTTVLRAQWGLKGYVVSDYDAMEQIYSTHHYANSSEEAVVIGIKAGCDMEGGGSAAIKQIPKAIKDGLLTIEDVDVAFERIIRTRILLGMFDPPTFVKYNEWYNSSDIQGDEHLNYSRLIAAKSISLYKNDDDILPLNSDNIKGIALIGPNAIGTDVILGNYCSYPDGGVVPIIQALRQELEHITVATNCTFQKDIIYKQSQNQAVDANTPTECCNLCYEADYCNYWSFSKSKCFLKETNSGKQNATDYVSGKCLNKEAINTSKVKWSSGCFDASCSSNSGLLDALKMVEEMKNRGTLSYVIIGLGLDQHIEAEGRDRSTIELPGYQNEMVDTIYNYTSKQDPRIPIICYLIHGGTLALGSVYDHCDALLDAWYPGQMGAYGLMDVMFGRYNPAGRAAVTSYSSTSVLPSMSDMNEYSTNGVTYRYIKDSQQNVLIPFGFGLSYTAFNYCDLSLNVTKSANSNYDYVLDDYCDVIQVSFNVENIGKYIGDEVVQLYVKHVYASVAVPNIRLGDFERVNMVNINEKRNVKLILTPRYRSVVHNETSKYWYQPDIQIEEGIIELYVGGGQPDQPIKQYLKTSVMVQKNGSFYDCGNQD